MPLSTEETLRLTVAALMQSTGETKTDLAAAIGLTQPKVRFLALVSHQLRASLSMNWQFKRWI